MALSVGHRSVAACALLAACSAKRVSTIPPALLDDDESKPELPCGVGAPDSEAEAMCDLGDYAACYRAAVPYFLCAKLRPELRRGERLRDEALAGAHIACESKSVDACGLLGMTYVTGILGRERNFELAAEALQRGCELGDANQCTSLGSIPWLAHREPTGADLYWLRRACRLGDGDGCDLLDAACRRGYSSAC